MKKKLCSILAILLSVTLYGCAEQPQETEAVEVQPLVIDVPERNDNGTLTVYAEGVEAFQYKGRIEIANDGRDGNDIEIFVYAVDDNKE